MQDAHAFFKLSRANTHEDDAIVMFRVHVRLDFEDESGEVLALRWDGFLQRPTRRRRGGHFRKAFKKRLHAEIRHRAAEVERGQLAVRDFFRVERISRDV